MKGLFGIASLLLALAITALLSRQQLTTLQRTPSVAPERGAETHSAAMTQPEQYKQALEAALQSPRSVPDDK